MTWLAILIAQLFLGLTWTIVSYIRCRRLIGRALQDGNVKRAQTVLIRTIAYSVAFGVFLSEVWHG